ncbi:hypothetical protein [Pseudomonas aeruginosa]|uniref:hypothetical protein n=1 Tax=Pseudomonas aeruginosa TaxID=287 RepID=UPI001913582C|nr:hypothetical protein [Pseudomonas aeruginosa]
MSNELTDVRCPCGAEFQADSYDAGFIAGSGMCQNCDAALPTKDICTCPSGDGSLRHPCPAHPALVEQAGGDERKLSDLGNELHNLSCSIVHENEEWAEQIGGIARELWNWPQARAALAQPSPAQAEKAEVERPEVVARVVHSNPVVLDQCGPLNANDELMTVAQHAASVARWAEMFNRVEQERDAALARVAELTATRNRYGVDAHYFNKNLQRILRDFESFTPDELARSLIILAKVADEKVVAQAQHSVPEGWYYDAPSQVEAVIIDIRGMWGEDDCPTYEDVAAALRHLLAAAPGKEVGHE